jgi:hypothetical protein
MFAFLLMFGDVVLFFVLIFSAPDLFDTATKQQLWCLFPPLSLQLGVMNKFNCDCGLFEFIGDGDLHFGTILGMLVLDSIIYSTLAWYLGQVVPSEFFVRRPFYFLLMPSFWGIGVSDEQGKSNRTNTVTINQENPLGGDQNNHDTSVSYACEKVSPAIMGQATVKVSNLRKTFGSFKAGMTFLLTCTKDRSSLCSDTMELAKQPLSTCSLDCFRLIRTVATALYPKVL